jgi:hypothetical protein
MLHHEIYCKYTEIHILKTNKKLIFIFIFIFFSTPLFADVCKNNVCFEFNGENIAIPNGYVLHGKQISKKEVNFTKYLIIKDIKTPLSTFTYGIKESCTYFCDESETKIWEKHQVIQTYALKEYYRKGEVNAKLWNFTTVSNSTNEVISDDYYGVVYTDKQMFSIAGDKEVWLAWVEQLSLQKVAD